MQSFLCLSLKPSWISELRAAFVQSSVPLYVPEERSANAVPENMQKSNVLFPRGSTVINNVSFRL